MTKQEHQSLITKDMTIGDVVMKYPQLVDLMQGYGLHCIGCSVNPFESLEQGAMGHGMSEDVFEQMLNDLNLKAKDLPVEKTQNESIEKGVTLTEEAAKKVSEFAKAEKKAEAALRIAVKPGGCSGFQYEMFFDDKIEPHDNVFSQHDVKVVVSPQSMKMLNGAKISYVETFKESGFKFENPNAKTSCGCGNSFG